MHFKNRKPYMVAVAVLIYSTVSISGCHHAAKVQSVPEDIVPAGTVLTKTDAKAVSESAGRIGLAQESIRRLASEPDLPSEEQKRLEETFLAEFNKIIQSLGNSIAVEIEPTTDALKNAAFLEDITGLIQWFLHNLDRFEPGQQRNPLSQIYAARRAISESAPPYSTQLRNDLFAFGATQFDAWAKNNHPMGDDNISAVEGFIVCPRYQIRRGNEFYAWKSESCGRSWYLLATETADTRKALTAYLKKKEDPRIAEVVFVNLITYPKETLFELLRDLEETPDIWEAGLRVVAEILFFNSDERALLDESVRIWKERPPLRPGVLLGLAYMDYWGTDRQGIWKDFQNRFGERISKETFESFLAEPTLDLALASRVWPALSKGWSPVDTLIPHLDSWLKTNKNLRSMQDPIQSLYFILDELCANEQLSEITKLRNQLQATDHANPNRDIEAFLANTSKINCSAPRKAQKRVAPKSGDTKLRIIQTEDE